MSERSLCDFAPIQMAEAIALPGMSLARCVSATLSLAALYRETKWPVCCEVVPTKLHPNGHARLYRPDCPSRLCQFAMPTLWQTCSRILFESARSSKEPALGFAISSLPTNKKVGVKCEPECFSTAEKIPPPDQLRVVP